MMASRKEINSGRAYAAPLFWVVILMLCYWILAEWQELPSLIASVKAGLRWPV